MRKNKLLFTIIMLFINKLSYCQPAKIAPIAIVPVSQIRNLSIFLHGDKIYVYDSKAKRELECRLTDDKKHLYVTIPGHPNDLKLVADTWKVTYK